MAEFVKYPKSNKRQMVDYNQVIESMETDGDAILCVPKALVGIIRILLLTRGLWRTTYVVDNQDFGYTIPSDEEFNPVKQMILTFIEETVTMNCEDFIDALNNIAASVRLASCCAPGSSTGIVEGPMGEIWYGTEEPVDMPTVFGPSEEFPTEEAFQEHLCLAANQIVTGIIASLNNWSILSLASLTVGGIIVASFVATPPIGVFIALAAAGFIFGALNTLANYIHDNRQEWVCAIYGAGSYPAILLAVDSLVVDALASLALGSFDDVVQDMFHAMLTTNVVNQAYKSVGLPPPIGEDVNCETCVSECAVVWSFTDGYQGWTESDESTNGGAADSTYDATNEEIDVSVTFPQGQTGQATLRLTYTFVDNHTINPGDVIDIAIGPVTGDGSSIVLAARVNIAGDTEEEEVVTTGNVTRQFQFGNLSGVITSIEIEAGLRFSEPAAGNRNRQVPIKEVRLFLSDSENCLTVD